MRVAAAVFLALFLSACVPALGNFTPASKSPALALPSSSLISIGGKTSSLENLLLLDETILVLAPSPEAIPEALSWDAAFFSAAKQTPATPHYALLVLPEDMRAYDSLLREEYTSQFNNKPGFNDVYIAYTDVEEFLSGLDSSSGKEAILLRLNNKKQILSRTSGAYTNDKEADLLGKKRRTP